MWEHIIKESEVALSGFPASQVANSQQVCAWAGELY